LRKISTFGRSGQERAKAQPEMPDGPQIELHGRITIENARDVRKALKSSLRGNATNLYVDLSDVPFIDTSAVATLVEGARIAREQGSRLILKGLHDQPRHFLELTHLNRLFDEEEVAG
jgi:anti-sigma B factor antagonist